VCNGVNVLAVSEDHAVRNLIETSLEAEGHQALCVSSPNEAFEALNGGPVWNLLLLDAAKNRRRKELFSPALLKHVGGEKVCILSEIGDTSWKTHAQSWNINNVLTKPLLRQDLNKLISNCAPSQIASKNYPPYHLEELDDYGFFLAASPAMIQMHKNIRILASVDYPVLILGESGVGKEIVARLLHKYCARPDKKFINVNTAAIPNELLESELFGYEAGAFTGAVKAKPGKFELADKGTLLLDEIGEMSPQMQAKLLHVLQDGSVTRLGAQYSTHVDVRILAATNVNMETAIAEKRFREDLYYRLNAFTIHVPALRERREEIPALIEQMALRGVSSLGHEPFTFSERLIEAAQEYHWPGNLRELRNFVTRLLVLQDEEGAYADLRAKTRMKPAHAVAGMSLLQPLDVATHNKHGMKGVVNDIKLQTEGRMIKEALSASGWNRRRAASNLNISYRALLYKIQQHGLRA
jgi:two-component system response regulator AtoC